MNLGDMIKAMYDVSQGKVAQLIKLGTGNTFDLTSYKGYENFTNDNFFFALKSLGSGSGVGCGTDQNITVTANPTQPKFSYNATTGILSVTNPSYALNVSGHKYWSTDGSASVNCEIYLITALAE